jgi:Cellulase (glycosyl hydrolase family 5)
MNRERRKPGSSAVWPTKRAYEWRETVGWLVGVNFIPSSAVNQLEMWQAETFDLPSIERELGWAAALGFNSVRVFLHDLLWHQNAPDFLQRVDRFLDAAAAHGIGTMFVLFDGVWNPNPELGAQPTPRLHVHNAGWVQSPGAKLLGHPRRHPQLEAYVRGVVERFGDDHRVLGWDLFNEPDNPNPAYHSEDLQNKAEMALALLEKAFVWAREVDPSQPLTCGVWIGDWSAVNTLRPIERFALENSDVITFHSYAKLEDVEPRVRHLRRYDRPILCTEYLARGQGSSFDPMLGYYKAHDIGAYNWGFVSGRTQTIYPWDSWIKTYDGEPKPWFHDILRADGTPYDATETDYIKLVTGREG